MSRDTFLIVQLSDVHVRGKGERYKDIVDSNLMLEQAIEHLHKLDRKPDLVLLTGDLVDYGRPNEYANAVDILSALKGWGDAAEMVAGEYLSSTSGGMLLEAEYQNDHQHLLMRVLELKPGAVDPMMFDITKKSWK